MKPRLQLLLQDDDLVPLEMSSDNLIDDEEDLATMRFIKASKPLVFDLIEDRSLLEEN